MQPREAVGFGAERTAREVQVRISRKNIPDHIGKVDDDASHHRIFRSTATKYFFRQFLGDFFSIYAQSHATNSAV